MKKTYFFLTFLLTILILNSCGDDFFSTTLEVDPPIPEKVMLTHAYLNIDSSKLNVYVSQTQDILTESFNSAQLENTKVVLTDDLNNIEEIALEDFWQRSFYMDNIGEDANEITLITESELFEDKAIASQVVPRKVDLVSTEFFEDGGVDIEGNDRSAVEVIFNDPLGEDNYYEAVIAVKEIFPGQEEEIRPTFTDSNDPVIRKGHQYFSVLFDDTTFDGQQKKIKFLMYPLRNNVESKTVYLQWRNISKEFFQFSRTLKQFEDQEDNPFTTPVQIFSNFENGAGIFSVYRQETYEVN